MLSTRPQMTCDSKVTPTRSQSCWPARRPDMPVTPTGGPAALFRDIFGTYAQRIHSYNGRDGLADAEQANHEITEALADWEAGDRTDVSGFANRWFGRVGEVDTTWLDEPGRPLRKVGALGHLLRRRLRR